MAGAGWGVSPAYAKQRANHAKGVASLRALIAGWLGGGGIRAFALFDPEIAALFLPIFRESFTQFGKRYVFGFASIKNQIDDIRGQIDQAERPEKKRPIYMFFSGQFSNAFPLARLQIFLILEAA